MTTSGSNSSISAKMGLNNLYAALANEIKNAQLAKTYKVEVAIDGEQGAVVRVGGKTCIMLASNNYLGLANHPRIKEAAKLGLEQYGFGMASVRFLCGTQKIHLELEDHLARFLGTEAAILHSSCWSANEAFFLALLGNDFGQTNYKDVIYSDQLNHASIIDGIRVARQATKRADLRAYDHNDFQKLCNWLKEDEGQYRISIISTDGVFSMEGEFAPLAEFVSLAKKHDALLFVDESHATGVLGKTGRGTPEACGVHGQIDVISGTLGKALGGAAAVSLPAKKI